MAYVGKMSYIDSEIKLYIDYETKLNYRVDPTCSIIFHVLNSCILLKTLSRTQCGFT